MHLINAIGTGTGFISLIMNGGVVSLKTSALKFEISDLFTGTTEFGVSKENAAKINAKTAMKVRNFLMVFVFKNINRLLIACQS